eukprot:gb/GEZN01009360.1/.p2 GENE.gb/GEZN01009360.1/~~gb/GEZN01009360.1/.p2  ORF type:complete len:130 (+),score=3.73 gb/GEZN01009360.1/:367-756(+)
MVNAAGSNGGGWPGGNLNWLVSVLPSNTCQVRIMWWRDSLPRLEFRTPVACMVVLEDPMLFEQLDDMESTNCANNLPRGAVFHVHSACDETGKHGVKESVAEVIERVKRELNFCCKHHEEEYGKDSLHI